MVFPVSATRVLAVIEIGSAVTFIICTTPRAATMGLRLTRDTPLPSTILLEPGLLDNAMISLVPTARVLAVTGIGFAVPFVIHTTLTATM